jgi:capsular exopolysaccharide synthesis family protein
MAEDPRLLPAPDGPGRNLPAPSDMHRSNWYGPEPEPEQPAVPLTHYLWILKRHKWKIAAFILASVVCTYIVSKRLTPIYESTATIDVDLHTPTGVVGQGSTVSDYYDADQFLATQIRLIQSDSVLRPVVQRYHLRDVGKQGQDASAEAAIRIQRTPVSLAVKVTRPPNTYLLLISFRSADPDMAANVANAVANSYLQRTFEIRYRATADLSTFMEKQIEELRAKMERSGLALAQFERELNVINPEEKTSVLSSRLLQLNTEYTNAETERVKKEAAWQSIQTGTLEAAQVSTQGESLKAIEDRLNDATQRFAEVKARAGKNHPDYLKAAAQVAELQRQFQAARTSTVRRVETEYKEAVNREAMLQKAVAENKAEFDKINTRTFQYQTLKREADADRSLYEELVRKIREAGINSAFQNSSIRIADAALPGLSPVYPNTRQNLMLALLLSTLLAVGAAVMSDVLDNTIRDPEQARAMLGAEVMGSLPMVKPWRGKLMLANTDGAGESKALAKAGHSAMRASTGYEEAVRTLRNSILLSTFDHPLKSLMVTSASPAEGKTTIAVHLAIAHAQQKHKTLLIDGDLRRPGVHGKLGLTPAAGLATALMNGLCWQDKVIQPAAVPGLYVLPAGPSSRRCADLIGANLKQILAQAEAEYDLVIVDAPPILGFPEPLQMAAAVDGVVMVAVAGETNRKAIELALSTLRRLRANVLGLVLNEITSDSSEGYYYHGYYGKYYKYYHSGKE